MFIKTITVKNFRNLKDEEKYQYKVNSNGELRFKYCPICEELHEDNADFSLNYRKGVFYCHRENKFGHINQLKKYEFDISKIPELAGFKNKTNPIESYIKIKNNDFEKPIEKNMTDLYKNKINSPVSTEWIEYLAKRGISEKTFKNVVAFDKFNNMMIPLSNGEKIVGIKYRSINKNLRSERESSSLYFMNWQNIKKFNYIIIVEGEIDLLSGLEIEANIVSLPFGASNIKCIENQKEWLSKFKHIIIATDNDKMGKKSKIEIVKELKDIKSNLLEVDLGKYKDFNEVLTSDNGRNKLLSIIRNYKKIR